MLSSRYREPMLLTAGMGLEHFSGCYCCSVAKLCLTFCNPMDCSTPGFSVSHYSWSLLKFVSIELVMLSNHLILSCHPAPLLLPSVKFMSIELVMLSNHLILSCRPAPLLLPSVFPSISTSLVLCCILFGSPKAYGLSLNPPTKTQMAICLLIVAAGFPVSDRGGSKGEVRAKGGNLSSFLLIRPPRQVFLRLQKSGKLSHLLPTESGSSVAKLQR